MVQRQENRQSQSSPRTGTTTIGIAAGILLLSVLLALTFTSPSSFKGGETEATVAKIPTSRMLNPIKSLLGIHWARPATTAASSLSSESTSQVLDSKPSTTATTKNMASRAPVYFVSHGVSTTLPHSFLGDWRR